jgi:maltose alpha-D-glucosyltransferase/alpha-amylase
MTPPDDAHLPLPSGGGLLHPDTSDPLWYKDAIIYEMHVKGSLTSMTTASAISRGSVASSTIFRISASPLRLMPFYPSPQEHPSPLRPDGGFRSVYPRREPPPFGGHHRAGNQSHGSSARAGPSPARHGAASTCGATPKFPETGVIFGDAEKSNWAWDPIAQPYYRHRFYAHQPDLDFDNRRVVQAVIGVTRFWLDLDVDGMRIEAVPDLIERDRTRNENLPKTDAVLSKLRRELDRRYGDRMLLAEANQ